MASEALSRYGPVPVPAGIEAVRKGLPATMQTFVPGIVDLVTGTQRAIRLGKAADGWFFTSTGAEQATHPLIAAHHAARFADCRHVVEVCTGAGIDARALAAVVPHVTTFEADPTLAALAEGNMRRAGIGNVDVVAQAVPSEVFTNAWRQADGLWADPSRRDEQGRRTRSAVHHDPPLGLLTTLPVDGGEFVIGIKLGPGDEVDSQITSGFMDEYIGLGHEARERILWKGTGITRRCVTLVDKGLTWVSPPEPGLPAERPPEVGDIIVEPHAALIASGDVGSWFVEQGLDVIDRRIAYGLGRMHVPASPWMQSFIVIDIEEGIDVKRMRRKVRELDWNSGTEIKKRGVSMDPMEVHHALGFPSSSSSAGVIVMTRADSVRYTLYAIRVNSVTA
ncbi:MAG: hypothetical protein J0I17_04880 ['Candidatus Kapabacteria' thiocyanatum]|uniref:THUMP-like domain-containing protein n=1 Tax=Candidatus Kapaibacterium thiocyanatum TaxID=1895771 RepID=A0A1M3L5I8_9BACT|nr:hypothetical protein ['Candidatus Kapabacteria' thiocyanatum]OJX60810.1 MAG: hypothetical protein BGO89_04395 ['Candidatus Kapabacteria' thiocyanatum]